ncbi:3-hydroxylacyl-ACP dehydratase [Ottowia thiooxydans]|uniref:3-hydroxylacyl-ACP dehydratase n=1 Tax=Ottowia thiooxydans TaxID=219182 RepID=UPI0003F55FFF|nr:3-hydroxylacyl-ACP dehydratase [Ottowia thiooxydans]
MTTAALSGYWASALGQARSWIAERIPHQGQMCLLDRVVSASPEGVTCTTSTHLLPDNPMRIHGELGVACGIEYAAQAMALHGALIAELNGSELPKRGYLVSVRNVSLHVPTLDAVTGELTVAALCEADNGDHCVYEFSLAAAGRVLLEGRAMVMLNAPIPSV